jgi:deoxyribonuclease-4
MPLFGAHLSIAGGLHRAIESARAYGCEAFQIFTASPQSWQVHPIRESTPNGQKQWASRPLAEDHVRLFRRGLRAMKLRCALAHDSYLINLAAPDPELYRRSIEAFIDELRRAEQLGLRYLVTHPGASRDTSEEAGLGQVARALDEVHARCPGFHVQVLLETTAGQGTSLGYRFEHLSRILGLVAEPDRVGVCFDTCHVFAAGYSLAPEREYRATMRAFDRTIGIKRLRAFHLNDSAREQGSRVDRHGHIGRGLLGSEPFRLLVNDPRFKTRPMILETPKEDGSETDMDAVNLAFLRSLSAER